MVLLLFNIFTRKGSLRSRNQKLYYFSFPLSYEFPLLTRMRGEVEIEVLACLKFLLVRTAVNIYLLVSLQGTRKFLILPCYFMLRFCSCR